MEIIYLPNALMHLEYWVKNKNIKVLEKITALLKSILETPKSGLGKPEALKHQLTGLWSRRINLEHRLVYEIDIENNNIIIHSLKGHYI